jgi:hypothetical protein
MDSRSVATELAEFEKNIQALIALLDAMLPIGRQPNKDQLAAIIDVCAWAHSEWIRIHPFANGNGRTARVWADSIVVRYGLPPFVRFRPRPGVGYVEASMKAMQGDWKPNAVVFRQLLDDFTKHNPKMTPNGDTSTRNAAGSLPTILAVSTFLALTHPNS